MPTPPITKTAALENYPNIQLLSGTQTGTSMATGTSVTQDVEVQGSDWLQVSSDLTGGANGDLAVVVTPYGPDGATLTGLTITPNPTAGPTFAAGHVRAAGQYDVIGFKKVQIKWTNNNAGTQALTASWILEGF